MSPWALLATGYWLVRVDPDHDRAQGSADMGCPLLPQGLEGPQPANGRHTPPPPWDLINSYSGGSPPGQTNVISILLLGNFQFWFNFTASNRQRQDLQDVEAEYKGSQNRGVHLSTGCFKMMQIKCDLFFLNMRQWLNAIDLCSGKYSQLGKIVGGRTSATGFSTSCWAVQ